MRWILLPFLLLGLLFAQEVRREGRCVWVLPYEFSSPERIEFLIRNMKEANIKLAFVQVKDAQGRIMWPSKRFSASVHPDFRQFDGLSLLLEKAHAAGIKVHAWLCDFTEGLESPVVKKHPEWVQRNPDGTSTASEKLAQGRPYRLVWMCPARRPGYVDQHLIPLMVELLKKYPVDGIHHDNICYPADVAPDRYCFCDWCTEHIFWHAHMFYENFARTRFAPRPPLAPRPTANWLKDYTIKPPKATWSNAPRRVKAEFLLRGSALWDGFDPKKAPNPSDFDFFFYTYRCDAVARFVREAWEAAVKVRPEIEFSAALFKNPILAARFAGQKWTSWADYLDVAVPRLFRSFFPGDFKQFLQLLKEHTKKELYWSRGLCHTYIGISVVHLYREEREPVLELSRILGMVGGSGQQKASFEGLCRLEGASLLGLVRKARAAYDKFAARLKSSNAELAGDFEKCFSELEKVAREGGETAAVFRKLRRMTGLLLNDPPQGFYPPRKLAEVVDALRRGGAEGISIFSSLHITRFKLWDTLKTIFKQPADLPHLVSPLRSPSVQVVRLLHMREKELAAAAKENSQLTRRLNAAEERTARLTTRIDQLKKEVKRLSAELSSTKEKAKKAVEAAQKELGAVKKELSREQKKRREAENRVAELERELAQKEALLKGLRVRLKSAEDEAELLRKQSRRALAELQDYQQKVTESERRLENQRYYERLRLVVAFGVAAIAFAVALIATMLKRKTS